MEAQTKAKLRVAGTAPLLEVDDLHVHFVTSRGVVRAVEGISYTVGRGDKGADSILTSTIEPGQKLARIEPRAVANDFKRFDWVKSVDVSRNWINGKVTITVMQRTPIAIYNDRAIDADGFSFIVRRENTVGLPRIQAPTVETAITAAAFFTLLPAEIANAVQLVKVRSGDAYVLEVKKGADIIEIFWGQDVDNALKVKVYTALIAQPENSKIERIDLSAPHAPIVK